MSSSRLSEASEASEASESSRNTAARALRSKTPYCRSKSIVRSKMLLEPAPERPLRSKMQLDSALLQNHLFEDRENRSEINKYCSKTTCSKIKKVDRKLINTFENLSNQSNENRESRSGIDKNDRSQVCPESRAAPKSLVRRSRKSIGNR